MEYNQIYNTLVEDQNDFRGLVAYGIYKRNKIDFIDKTKTDKGVDVVSDVDMEIFHRTSNTQTSIDNYKLQAHNLLSDTFMEMVDRQLNILLEEKKKEHINNIKSAIPGNLTTFGISVLSSILASIVISFILIFGTYKVKFENVLKDMKEIETNIKTSENHINELLSTLEQ